MSDKYKTWGQLAAVAAANSTVSGVLSPGTTLRGRIYEAVLGCSGTPLDAQNIWAIQRGDGTGAGTATAEAGVPTEGVAGTGPPAAILLGKGNYSAEPTNYGNPLFYLALAMRASFRWVARDDPDMIMLPAVSNAVVGLVVKQGTVAYSGPASGTLGWQE